MLEGRKQALSIRLNGSDLRSLRKLARRMGVRNSDVIRFALRSCIARLAPLLESEVRGKALVPVFVEAGADMVRYLDLDAAHLDSIINDGVSETENRVERADIHLLAGIGMQQSYARLRLATVGGARVSGQPTTDLDPAAEDQLLMQSLRRYFYEKYVYEAARQETSRPVADSHDAVVLQSGGQQG